MPHYSSFWSRVGAGVIDGFLLGVPTQIVLLIAYGNELWTSTKMIHGPLDFFGSLSTNGNKAGTTNWPALWSFHETNNGAESRSASRLPLRF